MTASSAAVREVTAPGAGVVSVRDRVMGSELLLIAVDPLDGQLRRALERLRELEQRWSRFLADSDVSRLNLAAGTPLDVAPETLTLLATMVQAWRDTAGGYDPTVLPALVAAGGAASRHRPQHRTVLPATAVAGGDPSAIVLDALRRTATIPIGMAIDAGGIGKGLAADLIVLDLLAGGAAGALCSIGGDLSMAGRPPTPDGWRIAVERPALDGGPDAVGGPGPGVLVTLSVSGGGVATSSVRSRRWQVGDEQRHHVIDPRTGHPSDTDLAAVTVFARSGWQAEAHATAALLRGRDGALAHLHGHGLDGIAIDRDGRVLTTDALRHLDGLRPAPAPAGPTPQPEGSPWSPH
ncbi:MAG: FAD:protein FMN transferase [Acidimicrobiia bacterium]